MFDDSHLFDDCKPVAGERETDVLLRIEKKLDKLIDLMSRNTPIPSNICSRYTYKGMVNGECFFEDEYGHRVTETELRRYQQVLKNYWNDAVDGEYEWERFWNEPDK